MTASMFGSDHSLMLQASSLTPQAATEILEAVRANRAVYGPGQGRVMNLVIDQIAPAGSDEPVWDTLNAITQYLPGGSKRACDNAFIGTGIVPWTGSGSPYREGMKSQSYRTELTRLNNTLATKFVRMYPGIHHHWYISTEAVLEWWVNDIDLRHAYRQVLSNHLIAFDQLLPGRATLWSPAFWTRKPPAGVGTAVAGVIKSVNAEADNGRGLDWLHLQDMQGRAWQGTTYQDTVDWMRALKAGAASLGHTYGSFRVNLELFEAPAMTPSALDELSRRVAYYRTNSLAIGACFEGRYWFRLFGGGAPVATTPVTPTPTRAGATSFTVGPNDPEFAKLQEMVESRTDQGETLQSVVVVGVHNAS